MRRFLKFFTPIFILLIGFGLWKWLSIPIKAPELKSEEVQKLKTEKLVLTPSNYQVLIDSQGLVRAHHETTITPLVSGTIQQIYPAFEDGAFFKMGDVLLELEPSDLKTAVFASESRVARAEAALIQEEARAKQARLNWQDIGYNEAPSPLVLRVPQLREAEANVNSAKADLEQAKRNLDRAKVRAPFDGRVKSRLVGVGQAVGATTQLGVIFGSDSAEIRLPLAPNQFPFVRLPEMETDPAISVILTDALADPTQASPHQWEAKIIRTEGTLDPNSRELFAIAKIDNPFGLGTNLPRLRIGQPLRAEIHGITLENVFIIPRSAMRKINEVYLIDQESLTIRRTAITPVWSNRDVMIVKNGIQAGAWLATSRMPYAPDLAPIELIEPTLKADAVVVPSPKPPAGS